jgi:hypothetical protein
MALSEELKAEAVRHGRLLEVPIDYRPRVGDKKINSVRDAVKNEVYLFRKRFGWLPRNPP